MATMVTPKLLLLDEHTAALDPDGGKGAEIDKRYNKRKKYNMPYGYAQYASGT